MFAKSALIAALVAVSANLVVATPPGCLLGAVNTQPNPGDLETICGKHASDVQSSIQDLCGSDTKAALSAFASSCKAAGVTVSAAKPSSHTKSGSTSHTTSKPSSGSSTSSASSSLTTSKPSFGSSSGFITSSSIVYATSTYFDSSCSCTKTSSLPERTVVASSVATGGSSDSGTTSGASATGQPSSSSASSTFAASGAVVGVNSLAAAAIVAFAGFLAAL